MSLLDHAFSINHLIVMVLLTTVIVYGITHIFTSFVMEIHILQMICKCSHHPINKECVGFLIGLLMLSSELALRLAIGYLEHTHGSPSQ
jgi:hypothetical protein